MVKRYDAGMLNDHGGGSIEWWQDYIRAEIERCNDHWESDYAALQAERDRLRELVNKLVDVKSEPDKLLCLLEKEARKAKEG
jgi:hypothetical protein